MRAVSFNVEKKLPHGPGRAGVLATPHGEIKTPAFVPVGTKATVKSLSPQQVASVGAQVVLANTYHLYLQPGHELVARAGGLGKFMDWNGPTMTDSGGFQVFSLGAAFGKRLSKFGSKKEEQKQDDEEAGRLAKVDDDGVTFRSHRDGSEHRFTPERSIEIQHDIGADVIFAFDECPSPEADKEYQRKAMERTHKWAERSLKKHNELSAGSAGHQGLFGIVQGGRFEDLRKESAKAIGAMELARPDGSRGGFDGFGIGGTFLKQDMANAVRWVNELLPEEKPRHLLGIGEPQDVLDAIENGCDTFDCVSPTRMGRTGTLYIRGGRLNIGNAKCASELIPVEEGCDCYTCTHFTRSYLHHLFDAKEMFAATLASIHNLRFLVRLVDGAREAIVKGEFGDYKKKNGAN